MASASEASQLFLNAEAEIAQTPFGVDGTVATAGVPADSFDQVAPLTALPTMQLDPLSVFDTQLAALYYRQSVQAAQMSGWTSTVSDAPGAVVNDGPATLVVIDVTAKDGDGAELLRQLNDLGLQHGSSFGAVASGLLDVSKVAALLDLGDLAFARESAMTTNAGLVTTQADSAQHANIARTTYAVDGTGIKVGVLSDSFDATAPVTAQAPGGDTAAFDVANDDLPQGGKTTVLQDDKNLADNPTDEGRGMAQLIHDLAPGAAIDFATANFGLAGFANNIIQLATRGADVIVDDIRYFAELYYQEDILSQAIDQVAAQGVAYFSSAGNYAQQGYEGAWVDGGAQTIGTTSGGTKTEHFMQFAPGQNYLVNNHINRDVILLEWDQPSDSASGPSPGATGNLDLFITNQDGSIIYKQAISNNIGHDALELIPDASGLGQGTFYIRVGLASGTAPSEIKIIDFRNTLGAVASNTNPGTVLGHTAAPGAIGVAAAYYGDTPQFGTTPPVVESFSSGGPAVRWYDVNGNRLAQPVIVNAPQITAVDGGNTSFFPAGAGNDDDNDGFPNFFGTSAAAPDAAAVAALMLQARSTLDPTDIKNLLMDSAIDMDDPSTVGFDTGFDTRTGAGLIQADRAVGFAETLVITGDNADNTIYGTHLADTLIGKGGADTMVGGAGDDFYSVDNAHDVVTEPAGQGTNDRVFASVSYTLPDAAEIEKFSTDYHAGTGPIDLTGNELGNFIYGNEGVNTLNGMAGDDILFGNGGADTLNGGNDNDKLYGGAGVDHLNGGPGNDLLDGGAGADVMAGGPGDDSYVVDDPNDVVTENAGEGTNDRVFASVSYTLTAGAEIEKFSTDYHAGTGAIDLTGNELGNFIYGNEGVNTLNGMAGDDILYGNGGDDTLNGGDDNDKLYGGAGVDHLNGGAGDDRLDGGAGADTMTGGTGNDWYFVDDPSDVIVEAAGEGAADRVFASVTYTLANGVDVETLSAADYSATTGIALTGNAIANVVAGNAGSNVINGGGGNDVLYGMGGADTFVFNTALDAANNVDRIVDFSAADDRIELDHVVFTALTAADPLPGDAFYIGSAAHAGTDRIIYDSSTGALSYDADGTGNAAAAIQFATLSTGLALDNTKFFVV